jgi:hypothetical protein
LVFCWWLPLAESLGVIHSSDGGASELTREKLLRRWVGLVDGALAKVEVVEAIVNIFKSQIFDGFLGSSRGQ